MPTPLFDSGNVSIFLIYRRISYGNYQSQYYLPISNTEIWFGFCQLAARRLQRFCMMICPAVT